jgi:adenylosuccinate synthase
MIAFYDVAIQYNLAELEKEFFDAIEDLKKLTFIDSEEYLHQAQQAGKSILCEGAQGSFRCGFLGRIRLSLHPILLPPVLVQDSDRSQ